MKKKILYLMHVDWDWIKQRPHFLGENLSNHYDLYILYPYKNRRANLVFNDRGNLKINKFYCIPFRFKNLLAYQISKLYLIIFIRSQLYSYKPDYIWLTSPEFLDYLPLNLQKKNIQLIYDCMDNYSEFKYENKWLSKKLIGLENILLNKANLIFVSSQFLFETIKGKIKNEHKVVLLRNAFAGNMFINDTKGVHQRKDNDIFKLCYIGTISWWFDFESIQYVVENLSNVEFHFIGPCDIDISKWNQERIKFYGPVNQDKLVSLVNDFDCMLMPFRINNLVKAVDPVKLYEYINFNKPIISVYYKEVEYFSSFVSFYSNKVELLNLITQMIKDGFNNKYSDKQRQEFLTNNSWGNRTKIIKLALEKHTQ
jgi:hypothetical protein